MLRTLYAKLSLALALLLISVGIFYTVLSLSSARHYLQQTGQNVNLDLAKNLVADRNLVESGRLNEKALKDTFMAYMVINPSIEIYLLDAQGKILSYSAEPGKVKRKSVSLAPIHAFLHGEKFPLLGDDPRSHDRQKIFSVTPIPSAKNPEGYLYVVLLGEPYDQAESVILESVIWQQAGYALVGSLLIALILGLFIFRKLTARLNSLSREMDAFRRNDFANYQPPAGKQQGNDEIDQLSHTFEQMAERMMVQLAALKQQDQMRRELVANVSHDLRTPIAILHGYLETLQLKQQQLSPHEQHHYLAQALQSSHRLSQLISELFELAKLDAAAVEIHPEVFNLAELADDVLQKFSLKAENKQIQLEFCMQHQALFVNADIGLIARLLENLIGNALKFTPEHGKISLALTENSQQILVSVSDTGPGIAAEDIDKVFDRFYQGQSQRNRTEPGGLGLAIAQRIVELHQGSIEVSSQPGQGARFCFMLPKIMIPPKVWLNTADNTS